MWIHERDVDNDEVYACMFESMLLELRHYNEKEYDRVRDVMFRWARATRRSLTHRLKTFTTNYNDLLSGTGLVRPSLLEW